MTARGQVVNTLPLFSKELESLFFSTSPSFTPAVKVGRDIISFRSACYDRQSVAVRSHSTLFLNYKGPCKRTQQVTTLLAQQCRELLALVGTCCVVHANERNNCQHCWRKLVILSLITAFFVPSFFFICLEDLSCFFPEII